MVENACGAPGAKGAGTTTGPGAVVTCAKGCRASLESLSARIRNGDTMRTVIANLSLTARIPSPSISREPIQPHSISQDKSDGLGYNRDLIGAAQALRFDSVPWNRYRPLNPIESNCVIGVCGSGGPSPVMATGTRRSVRMSRSKFVALAMLIVPILMIASSSGHSQTTYSVPSANPRPNSLTVTGPLPTTSSPPPDLNRP